MDPLEHKPLVPVMLEEFFAMDFFNKVTINMTSHIELEDEEDDE